jgi:NAD(P)-dependent dehydrogenase (short-subunit alcohol dehydrogenase family)
MSKLANILWTYELQKRLDEEQPSIIAISVHPGAVNTFVDRLPKFRTLAKIFVPLFFKKWDEGGYDSAFAAASPLVRANPEAYKGKYIGAAIEEGSGPWCRC